MAERVAVPNSPKPAPGVPFCSVVQVWRGRVAVLKVAGTVDMLTACHLEDAVAAVSGEDAAALIIDLTEVDFLASHGISVLVTARQRTAAGVGFAVVADGPATSRQLTLTGVAGLLGLTPTREAAFEILVAARSAETA